MLCKVAGCRFSDKHRTIDHECGTCHQKRHGMRECNDYRAQYELLKIVEEEERDRLTIVVAHDAADKSRSGTGQLLLEHIANIRAALDGNPMCYIYMSMGMGCIQYNRHTGTIIEFLFLHDTDDQNIERNPRLQAFVRGYTCLNKRRPTLAEKLLLRQTPEAYVPW